MPTARHRGQTLAEFALVLPILILIVVALFDLGRAVFVYNGLTNAVREGARLAIVNQDESLIAGRAQAMAFGIAIDSAPGDMTSFWRQLPNADNVESNEPCDGRDVDHPIAVGCIAVVEARATWQAITPIIGSIVGPITLNARSELPIEFVCPSTSIAAYATSDRCPAQP